MAGTCPAADVDGESVVKMLEIGEGEGATRGTGYALALLFQRAPASLRS